MARFLHMPRDMILLGSSFLKASFVLLSLGLLVLLGLALRRAHRRGLLTRAAWRRTPPLLALWWLFFAGVGASGVLNDFDSFPPPLMFVVVSLFAFTVMLSRSSIGTALRDALDTRTLIAWQAFRLPLELLMWRAFVEGVMPEQMSFTGYNFDVLTGVFALAIALGSVVTGGKEPPRWLAWTFNLVGMALLVTILGIAIASLPVFAAFGPERMNTWVVHFPFITLPGVMVPCAVLGHALLTRKLLHRVDTALPAAGERLAV